MRIQAPTYTMTPNDLFDHWLPHLGEAELKVLLVIMRKTFGWHKKRDRISITQLSKITGLLRETVINATKSLQSKGVIIKDVVGPNGNQETYYELVINEDSNNSYQSVEPTPPVGFDPLGSTDPQKKHSSSKETTAKEINAAASFYKELKDIDIPDHDKIEITKTYSIENVRHGLRWLKNNTKPLSKGIAAALKWACKTLPEIETPKKVDKLHVDVSAFNRSYFREINTLASQNGIRLQNEGLREGTSEYIQTDHEKIYYKDRGFLEQIANFFRKKEIKLPSIFDMIKACQCDLVKQL